MALTVQIGGQTVQALDNSVQTDDTIDGRSVASLDVKDLNGNLDFQQFTPITITDTTNNYQFQGFVNDSTKTPYAGSTTPIPGNIALKHKVNAVDAHSIPDKRYYAGPEYVYRYAGDIATDLLRVLGPEGISSAYAVDNDQSISDWQQGTLSNAVATNNISGGDLELAPSGSPLSIIETGSAFATGTLNNTHVDANGHLAQIAYNGIKIVAIQSIASAGNSYTYVKFATPNHLITGNDYFAYDVFVVATSPQIMLGIDFVCTDGTVWRDHADAVNGNDAQYMPPHPNTDLKGLADGVWYHRSMWIGNLSGKTIQYVSAACEGDNNGTYQAYFKNVYIATDPYGGTITQHIYNGEASLPALQQLGQYGYSSTIVSVVPCYNPYDYRTGPSYSLSSIGNIASTMVAWTSTFTDTTGAGQLASGAAADLAARKPHNGSVILIGYSLDGMQSYTPCVNGQPLPNFPPGISLSGKSIQFIQFLISGLTPEDTPTLNDFQFIAQPGYVGTKTDIINIVATAANWDAGTRVNTGSQGNYSIALNGSSRNWDGADTSGQTLYGQSGLASHPQNKSFLLGSDGGNKDVRSQFNFAGTWQNFTLEMDVYVELGVGYYGPFYRTTNFSNNDGTYAYAVEVGPSAVNLSRGNNSTGTGSKTQIGTTPINITAASWHRVKAVVNGSSHTIYLDDVFMFTVTDSAWTGAGYVGARLFNGAASNHTALFDNFGIVPALSGTWVSAPINLAPALAYMNSDVRWTDDSPNFTNVNNICEISTNGGTTWHTLINGGPLAYLDTAIPPNTVPIFTPGQSLSGISAKFRFTLLTTTATCIPIVGVFVMKLLGSFSGSGSRISEAISLAGVGTAGSTLVDFSGIMPLNAQQQSPTNIAVDTSLDGTSWTQIATGTPLTPGTTPVVGVGSIAGITTQSIPFVDDFTINESANYTSTSEVGGSLSTWIWDTTKNRVVASGGSHGVLISNTPASGANVDIAFVSDLQCNGGFVWRYTDPKNFYFLAIDDSSNTVTPNMLYLQRVVNGVQALVSSYPTTITSGIPHAYRLQHIGAQLTLQIDGVTVVSTTENTITQAGFAGLHNDTSGLGNVSNFYSFRIQFLGQSTGGLQFYTRVRLTSTDPTLTPQVTNITASVHNPNIEPGTLIPITNHSIINGSKTTMASMLDDLAKQCGNFSWQVKGGQFFFHGIQSLPAPWAVTAKDVQVANVEIDNINDQYRNSQWITRGKDVVLISETFVGNNVDTTFNTSYKIDSIVGMSVNNVAQSYGIKSVDKGDQWYWSPGSSGVVQDTTAATLPLNTAQQITIAYYGQIDIVANIRNEAEIARIAALDNTTGIVEHAESSRYLNKAGCIVMGQGFLNQYSQSSKTAKFTTLRSGLAVGQLASLFLSPLGVFSGAFIITDIKTTWKNTIQNGVTVVQPWYDVTAISGPIVGGWERFTVNLAAEAA